MPPRCAHPAGRYVAIFLLTRMCHRVVVYGFGSARAYGIQSPYHYFTGRGARTRGNSVHSFSTEERVIAELIANQTHVKVRDHLGRTPDWVINSWNTQPAPGGVRWKRYSN